MERDDGATPQRGMGANKDTPPGTRGGPQKAHGVTANTADQGTRSNIRKVGDSPAVFLLGELNAYLGPTIVCLFCFQGES